MNIIPINIFVSGTSLHKDVRLTVGRGWRHGNPPETLSELGSQLLPDDWTPGYHVFHLPFRPLIGKCNLVSRKLYSSTADAIILPGQENSLLTNEPYTGVCGSVIRFFVSLKF